MKRKSLLWSLTAATVMFFASCNNENIPQTGGEDATVKISVVSTPSLLGSTPEVSNIPAENKITTLEAYIFKGDALYAHAPQVNVENIAKQITLKAEKGTALTIAVVANESSIGEVASLTALKKVLSSFNFSNESRTAAPDNGFVMSHIEDNCEFTQDVNTKAISIKRTVSKFDAPTFNGVTVDLSSLSLELIKTIFPTFTEENRANTITFNNKGFYLANGLDRSLLFNAKPYETSWWPARAGWIPETLDYIKSEFDGDGMNTSVYSGDFVTTGPVYVHENYPYADKVVNGVTGYDPLEVYCFIVNGTLTWNSNTSDDRYWRINLVKETTIDPTDDKFRIFRNGYYKVNVDVVKTIGHGTPEEAEKETPVIPEGDDAAVTITVTPAPWDVYVSNTGM